MGTIVSCVFFVSISCRPTDLKPGKGEIETLDIDYRFPQKKTKQKKKQTYRQERTFKMKEVIDSRDGTQLAQQQQQPRARKG